MKKTKKALIFFLIIGLILSFGTCNEPEEEEGDAVLLTLETNASEPYTLSNDDKYPGAEINLQDLEGYDKLLDISKYGSITVNAELYYEGNPLNTQEDGLAHFKLLLQGGGSNWDTSSNIIVTSYNMKVDGDNTAVIPSNAVGKPRVLLVHASQESKPHKVDAILVKSITFTPKSDSNVVLEHVFGSTVSVNGNEIIFSDAKNDNGAAIYFFPNSDGGAGTSGTFLTNKMVNISYTIKDYNSNFEHQLVIQASYGKGISGGAAQTSYNGQRYPVLENSGGSSGIIKIPGNDLIDSGSKATINYNNNTPDPFYPTAIRIVNNGGTRETPDSTLRNLSYTLIINSIVITDN